MADCTISRNTTRVYAGDIWVDMATLDLVDTVVSGNVASGSHSSVGGGLFCRERG